MGNPLRNSDPSAFRLITIRTQEARLFMAPCGKVRRLIGGIIARYQEILGIEIYAYCFLGNHYHLLIRAPQGNADEFFENVNREISRRMNWRLKREGAFWGRRYSEQFVLAEDDLLEAFLYISTNPTRHGLIEDSSNWPGLNSYNHSLSEKDREFSFTHYSSITGVPTKTIHRLRLSRLPCFDGKSVSERRTTIKGLLEQRIADICKERRDNGKGFLGLTALRGQDPWQKPKSVARSPRPACYTSCPSLWREFVEAAKERRAIFKEASYLYRLGFLNYSFPEYSYLPPKIRMPRIFPFVLAQEPVTKYLA